MKKTFKKVLVLTLGLILALSGVLGVVHLINNGDANEYVSANVAAPRNIVMNYATQVSSAGVGSVNFTSGTGASGARYQVQVAGRNVQYSKK